MTVHDSWKHFEHGADIGVRGIAESESGAFEQTALAMMAVITDLDKIRQTTAITLRCQAPDHELLLTEWLNAIIYEMATRNMLFSRFEVELNDDTLNATLYGELIDIARHNPVVEIKGATYTALKVAKDVSGLWIAQCVVDV